MNGAVIVETRNIENLTSIIADHVKMLPEDWGLTIAYGRENEQALRQAFPMAGFNGFLADYTPESYCNDVMTSVEFWESIPYEKVLIFHHDSAILREGIEEFLEWDYIGSPREHLLIGGNGGLSLRSRSKIVELLKFKPYTKEHGNEDEYFSKYLHEVGGKVASREECFKFSCETIFHLGTLGYHGIDKYMTEEECIKIKSQYK